MKDYFSGHSKLYATFRPTYPEELYQFIFKHVTQFDCAWDCATGNGQVAQRLAKQFQTVFGTDISQQQLDHAVELDNIHYSISGAEQTDFKDQQFDLITVGQAMHWFDLDKFYSEVKRVVKPSGILAVWGYSICSVNEAIDVIFNDFYRNTVGPYWDSARKMVEDEYQGMPFPFTEIPSPKFSIEVNWTLEEFGGYLTTWSATQKFTKDKTVNPVPDVVEKLRPHWSNTMMVRFPVFLKLGTLS
jgi:ubiquinone/menaquinone biosynthesis C-methylase UbiE